MQPKADRIVGRREANGDWSAWFAGDPLDAWSGDSPHVAVGRLLDAAGDSILSWETEYLAEAELEGVFEIRRRTNCPECGGSGQYIGLFDIAACEACGGTGKLGVRVIA